MMSVLILAIVIGVAGMFIIVSQQLSVIEANQRELLIALACRKGSTVNPLTLTNAELEAKVAHHDA